jgi:hypothetical protein
MPLRLTCSAESCDFGADACTDFLPMQMRRIRYKRELLTVQRHTILCHLTSTFSRIACFLSCYNYDKLWFDAGANHELADTGTDLLPNHSQCECEESSTRENRWQDHCHLTYSCSRMEDFLWSNLIHKSNQSPTVTDSRCKYLRVHTLLLIHVCIAHTLTCMSWYLLVGSKPYFEHIIQVI